jgi:hypothetical protein
MKIFFVMKEIKFTILCCSAFVIPFYYGYGTVISGSTRAKSNGSGSATLFPRVLLIRICMFLALQDPDPLVRGRFPDPDSIRSLDPDP